MSQKPLTSLSPTIIASTPDELVAYVQRQVDERAAHLHTAEGLNTDALIEWGRAHDVMKLVRMLVTLDPDLRVESAMDFLNAVRTQTNFTTQIMREYKSISQRLYRAEELLAAHGLCIPSEELEEVEHA